MDEAERARIVEAYDRELANKLPTDYSPVARAAAVLLVVVAVLLPKIPGAQRLPRLPTVIALIAAAAIAWFLGKINLAESEALTRAERAIAQLAQGQTLLENERLQCAVAVIVYAYFSGGPYMRTLVDPETLRGRLGDSASYVEKVEEVLVAERKAYRVLTPQLKTEQAGTTWKQD